MPGTITIATIGDLLDHNYRMTAWCDRHGNREVDLKQVVEKFGREASYLRGEAPFKIRCDLCGAKPLTYVISAPEATPMK